MKILNSIFNNLIDLAFIASLTVVLVHNSYPSVIAFIGILFVKAFYHYLDSKSVNTSNTNNTEIEELKSKISKLEVSIGLKSY